jgi:hypothetical protein
MATRPNETQRTMMSTEPFAEATLVPLLVILILILLYSPVSEESKSKIRIKSKNSSRRRGESGNLHLAGRARARIRFVECFNITASSFAPGSAASVVSGTTNRIGGRTFRSSRASSICTCTACGMVVTFVLVIEVLVEFASQVGRHWEPS